MSIKDVNHDYIIEVTDDGPGVPFEFRERIFEMFTRLKSQDEVEGSGIGLAIVKRIIEKCGGSIELKSVSSGATFKFIWPKEIAAPSD